MFNTNNIHGVKHWTKEILKTTEMEEKILMQKSKVTWLKLGEGNNAYFHAIVQGKNKQIELHKMEDNNGNVLRDFKDIEKEILIFYGELIGTMAHTLLHVDIEMSRKGSQLQDQHRDQLVQQINEHTIWNALNKIGYSKASGVDGFTFKLFKETCRITKKDLVAVVLEFFFIGKLNVCINQLCYSNFDPKVYRC